MLSYDAYQNRIKRIAAVKNFIVRFRALFIALLSLLIALILAVIFTKGIITSDLVMPEKIVYGDSYYDEIKSPKALFSSADYQFARVGDAAKKSDVKNAARKAAAEDEAEELVWSYEFPALAGKYLVRTVTNKTFGVSYGEPKEFTIEAYPVDFVIESDVIVYGDMPEAYAFELINGDTLVVEGLKFDYDNPELEITNICAKSQSFVILDKSGNDVTFCYDINLPKKEVSVVSRDIELTPSSAEFIYDGSAVSYDGALDGDSIEALRGDTARIQTVIYDAAGNKVEGTPVNAGVYRVEVVPDGTQIYNGDSNVLARYNVTYGSASITVSPREISITTASDSKIYDGTKLENVDFEQSGLIEGHSIFALKSGADRVDAGTYANEYTYEITDSDGNDVTPNYSFDYSYGTLEISRRKITVTTADRVKTYDGEELVDGEYVLTGEGDSPLAEGQTDRLISSKGIKNAAQSGAPNEAEIGIFDGAGEIKTSNYEITYVYGTLTVERRPLKITTPSASWVYDGQEHFNADIKISDDTPVADGDEISVAEFTKILNYSEVEVINAVSIKLFRADDDATDNYDIEYENGTLEIEKRPLKITTPSASKIYDGKALCSYEDSIADNLAEGERLYCEPIVGGKQPYMVIINCGSAENIVEFEIVKSDFDWEAILGENGDPYFPTRQTTDNYDIEYVYGVLEITKRDVTIYTPNISKEYDGTPLFGNVIDAAVDNLADGEVLSTKTVASITDVGVIDNAIEYKIISTRYDATVPDAVVPEMWDFDPAAYDTTDNYNITYVYGKLEVYKRKLSVYTGSATKEYDGTALTRLDGWTVIRGSLVNGHYLEVDTDKPYASITDVVYENGEISGVLNVVHFKVLAGEEDKTANYDFSGNTYGMLKIFPRGVFIETPNGQWVYANTNYSATEPTLYRAPITVDPIEPEPDEPDWSDVAVEDKKENPLVARHRIVLVYFTEIKDAGSKLNECAYDIVDADGVNQTKNYSIGYILGTLTVTPRPLEITTGSASREYDDTPFTHHVATAEPFDGEGERGICDGHDIYFVLTDSSASVTFVTEGVVENTLEYIVYDTAFEPSDGNNLTSNYEITYIYGEIFVTERPIKLTTATSSREFDGEAYFDTGYEIMGGALLDGHYIVADGEYATVTFVTEGQVENKVSYRIEKAGADLTANYKIEYVYGKISRTVRYVRVKTADSTWVYDGKGHSDTSYSDVHLSDVSVYGDKISGTPDGNAGLVLGHTLVAESCPEVLWTGESGTENKVTYTFEQDGVVGNYCLVMEWGTLRILPRPIVITTATKERVYNADPFSYTDGWSTEGGYYEGKKLPFGLAEDDTLEARSNPAPASITDVGNIDNVVSYDIVDSKGTDINEYYEIVRYDYGKLTVTPRPILVKTLGTKKEYDGTPLTYDKRAYQSDFRDRGLLKSKNHTVSWLDEPSSITYIKIVDGKEISSVENVQHISIFDENKNDVTSNYDIEYDYGKLTILKKELTVTTASLSWDYDGEFHDETERGADGEPVIVGLVSGERYERDTVTRVRDYKEGGYSNDTTYKFYAGDTETTYCYNTKYTHGTLNINVNKISIRTKSAERVYNGQELTCTEWEYVGEERLPEGYGLQVVKCSGITDAGSTENVVSYKVVDADGSDAVNKNYVITCAYGTLTVTQRPIRITTPTDSREYDGRQFTSTEVGYSVDGGEESSPLDFGLVEGHKLKALSDPAPAGITDVGSAPNTVEYKVVDASGSDGVNANYKIVGYTYGTLTVTPRNIKVTTQTDSFEYDGAAHGNTGYSKLVHVTADGAEDGKFALASGHDLVANSETATKLVDVHYIGGEVAGVENVVEYIVTDENVNKNYAISYEYGTLTVTRRQLSVTLNKAEDTVYGEKVEFPLTDGKTFTYNTDKRPVSGQELVISIKIFDENGDEAVPKNVGQYRVGTENITIEGGESSNYAIEVTYSSFKIVRREITVKLNLIEDGKIYDAKAFSFPEKSYTVESGSLVSGDDLKVAVLYQKGSTLYGEPTDAGAYTVLLHENACTVNGAPAGNYKITAQNSPVYTIAQRELTLGLNNLSHAYCAEAYAFTPDDMLTSVAKSQVQGGDKFTDVVTVTERGGAETEAVDVGEYTYRVTGFTIFNEERGKDVTGNYKLAGSQPSAKIVIEKRKVNVSIEFGNGNGNSDSCEYTGFEIDLVEKYSPYGPYTSTPALATGNGYSGYGWGIYDGDREKLNAQISARKDGQPAELKELGRYSLSMALTGDALSNYQVMSYSVGSYEITNRQIYVIFKGEKPDGLEYNGESIDVSLFDYETRYRVDSVMSDKVGFVNGDESNYTAVYSLYSTYDIGCTKNLIGEILQAGTYFVKVELKYIGDGDDSYFIMYDKFNCEFTVDRRRVYVETPAHSDGHTHIYDGTPVDYAAEYPAFTVHRADGNWNGDGFVNDDGAAAQPVYTYYFKDYLPCEEAINAGGYTVRIVEFTGEYGDISIGDNYEVLTFADGGGHEYARFEILPATVLAVPVGSDGRWQELISADSVMYFPESEFGYEIKYVEGSDSTNLFVGDELSVNFKTSKDRATVTAPTQNVKITSASVKDKDGNDATGNYTVIITYREYNIYKKTNPAVPEISAEDYLVSWGFKQKTVTIKQFIPSVDSVTYGESVIIEPAWADGILPDSYIVSKTGYNSLLSGHRIVIGKSAVIANKLEPVTKWMTNYIVLDASGKNVSQLYKIVIEEAPETNIAVVRRKITVECENSVSSGAVTASVVEGSLAFKANLEVTVGDNGEYIARIYIRNEDLTGNYIVTFREKEVQEAEYASRI